MSTYPKLDRQQIAADLRCWDQLDDHRTGSAGERATDEWLAAQIANTGLQADIASFSITRRVPGAGRVTLDDKQTNGLVCLDGPLHDQVPIQGVAGCLGSDAAIGVGRFAPGGSPQLEKARRSGGHQVIVAISAAEHIVPGLAVQNAEGYRQPYGPPVLQVPSQEAGWLSAAAESSAILSVQAELTSAPATIANVQTTIGGSNPQLAPLIIMTPKSAWWTCTAERGGGICAWLACLRYFAVHQPARDVVFTANTGHELSHLGLDEFTRQNPQWPAAAHAWLHLGANFASREGHVLWQASDQAWLDRGARGLAQILPQAPRLTPLGARPFGEARNIFDAGGRYVSLLGDNRWFHHPDDRLDVSVDLQRTADLCQFILEVAGELARA
jgi:hypothetical protein